MPAFPAPTTTTSYSPEIIPRPPSGPRPNPPADSQRLSVPSQRATGQVARYAGLRIRDGGRLSLDFFIQLKLGHRVPWAGEYLRPVSVGRSTAFATQFMG